MCGEHVVTSRCHLPLPPPPGPPRIPLHSPGSAAAARLLCLRGRREQQRGVLGRGNCRLFASEKLSQAGGASPRGQSHRLTNFCLVALRFRRGFCGAKRFRFLRGAGTAFGCSSRGPSGRSAALPGASPALCPAGSAGSGSPAPGSAEFAFVSTCRSNSGFSFTVALQLHLLCFSVPFNPER